MATTENHKQKIIIRKDLTMRKGKMVAQGAHASLTAVLENLHDPDVRRWFEQGQKKICLGAKDEAEILAVYEKAKALGIICAKIIDEGLTEFNGVHTLTAIAIGPAPAEVIDPFTQHLTPL